MTSFRQTGRLRWYVLGCLLCFLQQTAHADLWAHVDERGVTHFAAEQVDARYQLFFRGNDFDSTRDTPVNASPLPYALPAAGARLLAFFDIAPDYKRVKHHLRAASSQHGVDYELLLNFLEEAQLDRVGAFAYSPVEGATANELPGAVPDEVREERRVRLMDFQEDISTQRLEAKIDREMTVLVDEVDEEGALARSPGDAPEVDGLVIIPDCEGLAPGDFVRERITDCDVHDLYDERIE